jgi:UDP-glucose:(heptosyl)LPS alpha-1,3-glucosyltransferase
VSGTLAAGHDARAPGALPCIAFALFKYFPYGGLQRDFLRIARACADRGFAIRVYTLAWQGERPQDFEIVEVPVRALVNHRRYERFVRWMERDLGRRPVALRVGFNKIPNLDVYYAADPCFEEKARELRHSLYRLTGRYRVFARFERAVFAPEARTRILLITARQQAIFQRYYGTPHTRFTVLPPPVAAERRRPADADAIRAAFRAEHVLGPNDLLMLAVGSGFVTKGLDRSLRALAALPPQLRARVRFHVVGADNPRRFAAQAARLGIADRVTWFGGRDDVQRFLLGADVLLHPAYMESGGIVLLEAMIAGLPVIATDVCGFAPLIEDAGGGVVLPSPFDQRALDALLTRVLDDPVARARWGAQGIAFGRRADLYGMAERAATIIGACARGDDIPA